MTTQAQQQITPEQQAFLAALPGSLPALKAELRGYVARAGFGFFGGAIDTFLGQLENMNTDQIINLVGSMRDFLAKYDETLGK